MSILIVDDAPEQLLILEKVLHAAGYEKTHAVSSAAAAFDLLGIGVAGTASMAVDLILMDLMMPEIDGLQACRKIKSVPQLSHIPIIVVTAKTDAESLQRAFIAGATDYIRKPVIPVELIGRTCSVLSQKLEMDLRKKRERELEDALRELKVLRGCAPICGGCKRIRNADGQWQPVDEFLVQHWDLKVNDTLCSSCAEQWRQGDAGGGLRAGVRRAADDSDEQAGL